MNPRAPWRNSPAAAGFLPSSCSFLMPSIPSPVATPKGATFPDNSTTEYQGLRTKTKT